MQSISNSQDIDAGTKSALLWVLWRHQGARSITGQAVRRLLGKGQYDQLSKEEIAFAMAVSVGAPKSANTVISVALLEKAIKFIEDATEHYSGMNDEVCQSYSEPWQEGFAVCAALKAIIDNK